MCIIRTSNENIKRRSMSEQRPSSQAFTRPMVKNKNVDSADGHVFTLMTYNILNDTCIRDSYKYCPNEVLDKDHRYNHIVQEVRSYNPDIVCMQEVHPDVYTKRLEKPLEELGFRSVYQIRDGSEALQGDAIFYKKELFTIDAYRVYGMWNLAEQEIKDLQVDSNSSKALTDYTNIRNQIVLVRLRHKRSGKHIHVASVHIIWGNLKKPDIQAFQVCAAIRCLEKFMAGFDDPAYILAGDFNTPPDFPAYQMLEDTSKPNERSLEILKQSSYKRDDGKIEYVVDTIPQALGVSLKLVSSYKNVLGSEPSITNCDDASRGEPWELCLDYIWFSPDTLEVAAVMKTPPDEDIRRHGGLPSVLFPSDHLPLMAQFKIK